LLSFLFKGLIVLTVFNELQEQVAKNGTGYEWSKRCADIQQIFELIDNLWKSLILALPNAQNRS